VASSSSANKVAKLAQKGKGKKVRFQGGTLFPVVIVIVVALLAALVVYARQSRPGPGAGEPNSNEHWHAAIGFYVCDESGLLTHPNLTGTLEETDALGNLSNQRYIATGIHSHGDGVMHWHPNSSGRATGTNAKLNVFLANYAVTLTNTKLAFPVAQGAETYEEGKTKCKVGGVEKTASLKLWVWDNYSKVSTEAPQVYTANMGDVRIKRDGMVFMVAFVPDDTKPKAPATAFNLLQLGAADGSGSTQTTTATGGTDNQATTTTTIGGAPGASTVTSAGTATSVGTAGSTPTGEPAATSTGTASTVTATTGPGGATTSTAKSTATTVKSSTAITSG
jgi:hypothetical protein